MKRACRMVIWNLGKIEYRFNSCEVPCVGTLDRFDDHIVMSDLQKIEE